MNILGPLKVSYICMYVHIFKLQNYRPVHPYTGRIRSHDSLSPQAETIPLHQNMSVPTWLNFRQKMILPD
jgi:hypothetical protein